MRPIVFKFRGAILAVPALVLIIFGKPTALSAAIGIPLALAGEVLRCWAVGYSGVTTRSDHLEVPALVTAGPYAHVRNPLYVGNFITALGFAIAFTGALPQAQALLLIVAALIFVVLVYAIIVPYEEGFLRDKFGVTFEQYCTRVPRVIPQCAAAPGYGTFRAEVIRDAETRTFVTFAVMLGALALKAAFSYP